MSVREAQARIDSREFAEWMAYYGLEPWGEERADHRAGVISSTIANVNRNPNRRSKPYTAADFFPELKGQEDARTNGAKWREFLAPFKPTRLE